MNKIRTSNVFPSTTVAGDVVVASNIVYAPNVPTYQNNKAGNKCAVLAYTAPVARVQGITVATVSNNAVYSFDFTQEVNGEVKVLPFSYTSDASATEAEITAAIVKFLIKSGAAVTTVVAGPLVTITALITAPVFSITNVDAKLTLAAASPAGTKEVNGGAQLLDKGIVGVVEGGQYKTYTIEFDVENEATMTTKEAQRREHVVVVDKDAAALVAALDAAYLPL